MLEIRNIVKDYETGSETVHALKGVSIAFRESELVSILGQSGCGKTTLLNIIGGLDQYTSGDLIINGQSTKQYKSADWDIYRNHSVGFIFQSYNLIPHQSVLSNVELALTLSGVSKAERRRRAKEALGASRRHAVCGGMTVFRRSGKMPQALRGKFLTHKKAEAYAALKADTLLLFTLCKGLRRFCGIIARTSCSAWSATFRLAQGWRRRASSPTR